MSLHTKAVLLGHLIDVIRTVPYWLPAAIAALVGVVVLTWETSDPKTGQEEGE